MGEGLAGERLGVAGRRLFEGAQLAGGLAGERPSRDRRPGPPSPRGGRPRSRPGGGHRRRPPARPPRGDRPRPGRAPGRGPRRHRRALGPGEGLAGQGLGVAGGRLFEGAQVAGGLGREGRPVIGDLALERPEVGGGGLGQAEGTATGRVVDRLRDDRPPGRPASRRGRRPRSRASRHGRGPRRRASRRGRSPTVRGRPAGRRPGRRAPYRDRRPGPPWPRGGRPRSRPGGGHRRRPPARPPRDDRARGLGELLGVGRGGIAELTGLGEGLAGEGLGVAGRRLFEGAQVAGGLGREALAHVRQVTARSGELVGDAPGTGEDVVRQPGGLAQDLAWVVHASVSRVRPWWVSSIVSKARRALCVSSVGPEYLIGNAPSNVHVATGVAPSPFWSLIGAVRTGLADGPDLHALEPVEEGLVVLGDDPLEDEGRPVLLAGQRPVLARWPRLRRCRSCP